MKKYLLFAFLIAAFLIGCSSQKTVDEIQAEGSIDLQSTDEKMYLANADIFVKEARAANLEWTAVRLEMGDDPNTGEMWFRPKDITLEAGKPYKLEMVNTGVTKHEFEAEDFFRTVAFRKVEDKYGEIKAPYFTEIEVFAGEQVDLYFIPIVPGIYDTDCKLEGHHEAGMFGTITVIGEEPTTPTPEFKAISKADWLQNGAELVKQARAANKEWTPIRLEMGDDVNTGEMWFRPKTITLKANEPYMIQLVNTGSVKHEYEAIEFFKTVAFRKAEDASGEFKAPMPTEVEVFAGEQIDLYLIPTKKGNYNSDCLITGHHEAGMFGNIVVE